MKKLGFGLMRLPITESGNVKSVDQNEINNMADLFIKNGFTYFDTAYSYHKGASEAAFRKAVTERYPREAYTITDKMPAYMVTMSEDYSRIFDEQLERCGVEYFDYYLLHALNLDTYESTVKLGGFELMKQLKAEGKAKHIGLSFHDKAEVLDRMLGEHPEMEYVLLQINYLDWDSESVEARKCYEIALKHKKPVMVMEPLKGGALVRLPEDAERLFKAYNPEASAASWALRFVFSLENVFVVLSGMNNFKQVADNISTVHEITPLNYEEKEIVKKAAEIIKSGTDIPCTACRYCVDSCPQNIPIPEYFSIYNDQKRYGYMHRHLIYYEGLALKSGSASDCIGCRKCEEHCPQHIEISKSMKDVAAVFDKE